MLAVVTASATHAAELANGIYTIQQQSTGRFLDAYQSAGEDYGVVTRENQDNNTQEWFVHKSDHAALTGIYSGFRCF